MGILHKVYFLCPKFHNIIFWTNFYSDFESFPVDIRSYLQSRYPLSGQWYRLKYFSFLFFVTIWNSSVSRGIYELKEKFPYMRPNIFKFSEPILYSK